MGPIPPSRFRLRAIPTRLNARVALSDQDDHWELALIGRNLTDKKIVAYGLPAPFVTGAAVGALDLPRTIAVQVTGRF